MIGKINWNPTARETRLFGVVLIAGFALISSLLAWRGRDELAQRLFFGAVAVGGISIILPPVGFWFYRAWMAIGFCVGSVVTRAVLLVIFFGILTPFAVVFRILKRDPLAIRPPRTESYWQDHPEIRDKSAYEHLY